jgi:hypothetical protein
MYRRIHASEDKFCGVGEKTEKVGKGIFRLLERICFLDESKTQQAVKNANLETFILTIVSVVANLQK